MQKDKNEIWAFLSSVKLALYTFFILAITSVIGTVIPQGKEMAFYVEKYGSGTANFFQILNVPNMYGSWWFISLLVLFSLNLLVCTIDRFPNIWRLVTMDNLALELDKVLKMPKRQAFKSSLPVAELVRETEKLLPGLPWQFAGIERDGGKLFAAQKGNWSRLGVIMVHVSILVIFAGAIIGLAFGYKGFVMIPEGKDVKQIFAYDAKRTAIPLDFTLRCDRFLLELYDNGAPKEFLSDLVVVKDGQEVLKKSIEVNDPLQYGGLTFYQSSYDAYDEGVVVEVENGVSKAKRKFIIGFSEQVSWPEEKLTFGVVNRMSSGMGLARGQIWFKAGESEPVQFWVNSGQAAMVERPNGNYVFYLRPLYATGLQVTRDPGVWAVYLGCGMMLAGLYIAFFLSHRKMWLYISNDGVRSTIQVTGSSNKNKIGFENDFAALVNRLEQSTSLKLTKE
ncbi:MAG: cytochrome c biogenesis protein ResB [Desulfobulbaceae bacterium]|nr:cytochrome c biogenesis protein ResB [Desulfobulbaceae bacterium]